MDAQRKRSLWQIACQTIVYRTLAVAVSRCYVFLTGKVVDDLLDAWPKTVASIDADRIGPLLAEGYVKAVERGNVDTATHIAWRLKHRGRYNSAVQEKFFARHACEELAKRVQKRTSYVSTPEGAWEAERALQDMKRLGYRVDEQLLETLVLLWREEKPLVPLTEAAAAFKDARRRNDPSDPVNLLKTQKKQKLERRQAAGRTLSQGELRFLHETTGGRSPIRKPDVSPRKG
jgi:hypothetical protein